MPFAMFSGAFSIEFPQLFPRATSCSTSGATECVALATSGKDMREVDVVDALNMDVRSPPMFIEDVICVVDFADESPECLFYCTSLFFGVAGFDLRIFPELVFFSFL